MPSHGPRIAPGTLVPLLLFYQLLLQVRDLKGFREALLEEEVDLEERVEGQETLLHLALGVARCSPISGYS